MASHCNDTVADNERRVDTRRPVAWHGQLEDERGNVFPCSVRDVSLAGVLVECAEIFEEGVDLLLTIDDLGDFAGRVRWHSERGMGLMLLAGPDLMLKKFAERAGADLSRKPDADPDPIG